MRIKVYLYSLTITLIASLFVLNIAAAQCSGSDIAVTYSSKCLPALVSFYVSPALPKGSIYYWDLGDGKGQVLGADTFYHQYSSGGSYGITVTITKPDGTKCAITKPKGFVSFNAQLVPGFYADQTIFCSIPAIISLHDTTQNSVTRDWFINGKLYSNHSADFSFSDSTVGNLTITLIAHDIAGCSQNLVKQNYISFPQSIPVNFCSVMTMDTSHTKISAKYKIGFDTSGYNISEIDWSFPSGNPSTYSGVNPPLVSYSNISSSYDVSITVKTNSGCIVSFTKKGLVGTYFSVPKSKICASDTGIIYYVSPHSGGPIGEFYSYELNNSAQMRFANGSQYLAFFNNAGTINFKCSILFHGSNCPDTLIVPNLFTVLPPTANFTLNPSELCTTPSKMNLNAANGASGSSGNSYTWQIFDSSMHQLSGSPIGPITQSDTSFIFNQYGIYSIKLISSNTNGCTDTVFSPNVLRVGTPDANFKFVNDTICAGDILKAINLTKFKDAPHNTLNYKWLFYDIDSVNIQQVSYSRSPSLVFNIPGIYNLSYYIQANYTCTAFKNVNNAVYVDGIIGNIVLSGNKSCAPVTYTASADIKANFPNNSPLTYFWSVSPSVNASISNPNLASPDITFNKQGNYSIILKISNGFCSSIIHKDSISIGTVSNFLIYSFSCRNIDIHPQNLSSSNANSFKWSVVPATGFSIDNDTIVNPTIKFINPGCYRVYLQTSDRSLSKCPDTISMPICIHQPPVIRNVYSPDSSSHCSPRIDSFYLSSIFGKSFFWDFGDSSFTTNSDSQVTHGYYNNNSAGYTVKTVAIDSNGCTSDTFVLKNYIKISGPEPSFSLISNQLCDSGTINFVDNSKYVYNYYFVYGDNSGIDNNRIEPHFYKYEDYSKDSNIYNPTMYAYDETGCLASASASVKLYRPPILKISSNDTVGCIPYKVQFLDSTKYGVNYFWNFGDGSTDTSFAPMHDFTQASTPGNDYKVTLTATTDKGCSATSLALNIVVHLVSIPKMTIIAPKILCYQDSVHFQASTSAPVSRYQWNFGDGNIISDTSSSQDPVYHYTFSGHHKVKLTVYTKFGCSAQTQDSTSIDNLDSTSPVAPKIHFITVTPLNQIKIVFSKSLSVKFDHYTIYRYPGPDSIYATNIQSDTVYFDIPPSINVNSQSYAYSIKFFDLCGLISNYSVPQHSIYLVVNKFGKNKLQLVWNKYTGWDSVKYYQIFRMNKGKFVQIGISGPLDSTYLDTNLCPGRNIYYVNAVNSNGLYFSASDTSSNIPDYQYQSTPLVLAKATVLNNKFIYLNWNLSLQPNFKFYSIDRYSKNTGWIMNFANTVKSFLIDSSVDVYNNEYIYRVSTVDECGDISPISNIGTSILLKSIVINDARYLNWNSYSNWSNGVSSYHVQIIQDNGQFKDVATLPSSDTTYFDSSAHSELDVPSCYRVYAVENPDISGNIDTSLSNITCPNLPARIFIPDAFTPNADSVNDIFMPKGLSIINNTDIKAQEYDFRIYDKWGELVFETHDFKKGWDGKYNGSSAPSGVYIYIIDAQGFNGQRFYLKGNVTLVK